MSHEGRSCKEAADSGGGETKEIPLAVVVAEQPSLPRAASSSLGIRPPPSSSKASAAAAAAAHVRSRTTKSTGKDRHSKVNTARGPRDRRVRLSVSTAIQFYDIQDRLGFDQPSKAIEWLLRKAKPAIDELNQLPPPPLSIGMQQPSHDVQKDPDSSPSLTQSTHAQHHQQQHQHQQLHSPEYHRYSSSPSLASHAGQAVHEPSEFTSRVENSRYKTRERGSRERGVKERASSMSPAVEVQEQQQEAAAAAGSTGSGLNFGNIGSGLTGLIESPNMRSSSFTQLLQSPFPPSLQSLLQSSSQSLLHNPLLSSLYQAGLHIPQQHHQQPHNSFVGNQSHSQSQSHTSHLQAFQRGQQQQEQDFMLVGGEGSSSGGGGGGGEEGGGGGSGGYNFVDHQVQVQSQKYQQQQQQHQTLQGHHHHHHHNWPVAQQLHNHHHQQHQSYQSRGTPGGVGGGAGYAHINVVDSGGTTLGSGPPFYLVPARIQGMEDEGGEQQEHQHHHQYHHQQQRRRRGED